MSQITVDHEGSVLRGLAVPWGERTVVSGAAPGRGRIVHEEVFDTESIQNVGALYGKPLLIGHDSARPVGKIRLSRSTEKGLEIEADLVAADVELEGIRRRLEAGLQSGLSVGFIPDSSSDQWYKPVAQGRLPRVVRRNAEIREVSLVMWPAYASAGVSGIHKRTSVGERRHSESQRVIHETEKYLAEMAGWQRVRVS